ncbi:glutamate ABC transporter substrate-binding protein, partial [Streptosporangium algeriense]
AAAVAVLLVAGAGVVAYTSGWLPRLIGRVQQSTLPPVTPDPTSKRFSSAVDKAASTHRLTIGMRDFLPGVALNNGGTWQGFEVDLATAIAKRLDVPASGITFRGTSREERPKLLASGEVDLVISTYSINKTDDVTFAGPYYVAHVDVLVKGGSAITSVADLEGRKICQPGASASVGALQDVVKRLDLVATKTYTECMNLLLAGEVDAVPGDDLVLAGFANREKIRYKVVGLKLTDEHYAVAVRKGDERTCKAVQGAIVSLYRDGTIGRLLDRHFSKVDFSTREDTLPTMAGCG